MSAAESTTWPLVLWRVSAAGIPRAAIVGFAVTDRFEIVFDTLQNTRKVQNLRGNSRAALVIGGWDAGDERTVQYDGTADNPQTRNSNGSNKPITPCTPTASAAALWTGLIYVRVKPEWIRYSDYNRNPPEIVEFTRGHLAV